MQLPVFLTKAVVISSAIASFSGLLLAGALPANAQLGMAPLFLEDQSVRGRSQGVITLSNVTDSPVRVRLYSEPFTYGRSGFVSLDEDPTDLSDYLQFSPREAVIPAKSEQRIRLLSLFPPSLPEGEYRTIVFAEELFDGTLGENEAAVSVRIGSTVYVHKGELSPELTGLSAQLAPDKSTIDLLVGNEGSATARAMVGWQLEQSGNVIAEGESNPQTVIANGDRNFSLKLPSTLPSGSYTLRGELSWTTHGDPFVESFELPVLMP